MANVTGWKEFVNGSLVEASYKVYNEAWGGHIILAIWVVLSAALFLKTKNITLTFSVGLISFLVFYQWLSTLAITTMILVLAFELGSSLYSIFWKN